MQSKQLQMQMQSAQVSDLMAHIDGWRRRCQILE
jgi:hypothetical protein